MNSQLTLRRLRTVAMMATIAAGLPVGCNASSLADPRVDALDKAIPAAMKRASVPGVIVGIWQGGREPWCEDIHRRFGLRHGCALAQPGFHARIGAVDLQCVDRQLFAQGKVGREELLETESRAYHAPGTCTFYGTANSNQMLMEVMGLHLPGAAFIHPNTPLRDALTEAAAKRVLEITDLGENYAPVGWVVDERAIVNGIVGLLATGGSTNHTIHLVAIAQAAGILINWDDFSDLSAEVPLLAKIYPNGARDVNHFHFAGGMGFLIGQLLDAGLLHGDTLTVAGPGLDRYGEEPYLDDGRLAWRPAPPASADESVLRPLANPFSEEGGLKLLTGNLGRAVIKTSAVKPEHWRVEAPAIVFNTQEELMAAFDRGELRRDFVAVVRYQGPQANGMPELHKLTPPLGVLQDDGFKVALVTDGRMSGASGKVPAAIHLTPESLAGGPLAKVRTGDVVVVDARNGLLQVRVAADEWARRKPEAVDLTASHFGLGRELFAMFRANAAGAEQGAMTYLPDQERKSPAWTDAHSGRVQDHFVYADDQTA